MNNTLIGLSLAALAYVASRRGSSNIAPSIFKRNIGRRDRAQAADIISEIWINTKPPTDWKIANVDTPQMRSFLTNIDPKVNLPPAGTPIQLFEIAGFLNLSPGMLVNMVKKRHSYSSASQVPVASKSTLGQVRQVQDQMYNSSLRQEYNRIYGISSAKGATQTSGLSGGNIFGAGTMSNPAMSQAQKGGLSGNNIFGTGTMQNAPISQGDVQNMQGGNIFGAGTMSNPAMSQAQKSGLSGNNIFGNRPTFEQWKKSK